MTYSKVSSILALSRPAKRTLAVASDSSVFVVSTLVMLSVVHGLSKLAWELTLARALLAAAGAVLLVAVGGGYSTINRYMSTYTPALLATASLVASALLVLTSSSTLGSAGVYSTLLLTFFVITFSLNFGARLAWREISERVLDAGRERKCVAVYGAGEAGRQLVSALRGARAYKPALFIDDNPELHGLTVLGLKVHPSTNLHELLSFHRVTEVFLAIPSADRDIRRSILSQLSTQSIRVKAIPHLERVIRGQVGLESLCPVDMEEILGRRPVAADPALLRETIEGRSVLVTGAGGSIGSELCRTILKLRPAKLLLFEMSEVALFQIEQELQVLSEQVESLGGSSVVPILGNVRDTAFLNASLIEHDVDTVFHAAAYKHVPLVEFNPVEGARNNILGTQSVVDAVRGSKVSTFVLISTDKAVRPTNVMGASKRVAEMIVQVAAHRRVCRMSIVRFGNVLDSSGSVLPAFNAQMKRGGPINVTHPEVTRYFMTIPEAAQLVIQAGALGTYGDVFHLDMGEPVQILTLARRLLSLHGLKERTLDGSGDIEIKITGLRRGEKLHEELLIDNFSRPTIHPRIFIAQEGHLDRAQLSRTIARLTAAFEEMSNQKVVAILEEVVEGYTPDALYAREARSAREPLLSRNADRRRASLHKVQTGN